MVPFHYVTDFVDCEAREREGIEGGGEPFPGGGENGFFGCEFGF